MKKHKPQKEWEVFQGVQQQDEMRQGIFHFEKFGISLEFWKFDEAVINFEINWEGWHLCRKM